MAVQDLIQERARRKSEQERMKKLELEAAREIVQPFLPELKGDTGPMGPAGPAGKEGINGKDGVDGRPGKDGKDADEGKIKILIQQLLDAQEEGEEDDDESFDSGEREEKRRKFVFTVQRDANGLIKNIIAEEE